MQTNLIFLSADKFNVFGKILPWKVSINPDYFQKNINMKVGVVHILPYVNRWLLRLENKKNRTFKTQCCYLAGNETKQRLFGWKLNDSLQLQPAR